jgi:hypothetical protein
MTILGNGNVGIGTTSPSYNLDLTYAGEIRTGNIHLFNDQQTIAATENTLALFGKNSNGGIGFYTTDTTTFSDAKMYIINNGNVGIGTTSPDYPLHIQSDTLPQLFIQGATGASFNSDVVIRSGSGPNYTNNFHQIRFEHYATSSGNEHNNRINFEVNGGTESTPTTRMTIRGDGNVGIGTTSPARSLDVIGEIKASTNLICGADIHIDGELVFPNAVGNKITFFSGIGISLENALLKYKVNTGDRHGFFADTYEVAKFSGHGAEFGTNTSGVTIGYQAGYNSGTQLNPANSVMIGYQAGYSASGSSCTGVGFQAVSASTGNGNTGFGTLALSAVSTGSWNVGIGYGAGHSDENSFVKQITTGSYNTFLGCFTRSSATTHNYSTAIGWGAEITASKQIVLGNATQKPAVKIHGGATATSFNATSDYRVKENVQTISGEIYTVDNLRPVSYILNDTQEPHIGFIAHELQEHVPTAVKGEKDGEEMQSVNYSELIPILVKEIQDLKKEVRMLKERIKEH